MTPQTVLPLAFRAESARGEDRNSDAMAGVFGGRVMRNECPRVVTQSPALASFSGKVNGFALKTWNLGKGKFQHGEAVTGRWRVPREISEEYQEINRELFERTPSPSSQTRTK